jgi:ADP-heptose:LPS heptosyltransferase
MNPSLNRHERRQQKNVERTQKRQEELARQQMKRLQARMPAGVPSVAAQTIDGLNPAYIKHDRVEIQNQNFRDKTQTQMRDVIFKLMMPNAPTAAMGDMISWLPAIKYVAENYNYVLGHLVVPGYFVEIAEHVIGKYKNWKVHADTIPDYLKDGYPLKEPLFFPINATGMHLTDLGFIYFLHTTAIPDEAKAYPTLDLQSVALLPELTGQKYAVMTPCMEAVTRTMLARDFNLIQDHLISKGITPVYLGKTAMVGRAINIPEGYDMSKGINLLNKTTLLQAAKILENAQMVIGIDNGLLHLASMTEATVLYGFTIAGPKHRRILRTKGQTYELFGDKEKIKCLFCQETTRYFFDHHFTNCLYKEREPACIRALNAESWNATIDQSIKDKTNGN